MLFVLLQGILTKGNSLVQYSSTIIDPHWLLNWLFTSIHFKLSVFIWDKQTIRNLCRCVPSQGIPTKGNSLVQLSSTIIDPHWLLYWLFTSIRFKWSVFIWDKQTIRNLCLCVLFQGILTKRQQLSTIEFHYY